MSTVKGWSGERVLVTGATGQIGSHVLALLEDTGVEIHAVTRAPRSPERRTRWWHADLSVPGTASGLFDQVRPDVVCHLAGCVNGARSLDALLPTLYGNLVATVEVLEAATRAECRRVVVAGSLLEEPGGGDTSRLASPYGASRWASSAYSLMCHRLFRTPVVVLRPSYVYGPCQADLTKLIPHVIGRFLDDEDAELASGERSLDMLFARDAAMAFCCAMTAPGVEGNTIDLVSGMTMSVRDIVMLLHSVIDPPTGRPRFGEVATRVGEQTPSADPAPAQRLLGWSASTGIADGIRATVEWWRAGRAGGTQAQPPAPGVTSPGL